MVADLIGARKEARRRKRVWEEWAIREYGGVGIAYNNPNVTFSKVDDMFKGKYILFCFKGGGIYENLVGTNCFKGLNNFGKNTKAFLISFGQKWKLIDLTSLFFSLQKNGLKV